MADKDEKIFNKVFNRELNGYSTIEVDTYINNLIKMIQDLKGKNSLLKEQIDKERAKMQSAISDLENKLFEQKIEAQKQRNIDLKEEQNE